MGISFNHHGLKTFRVRNSFVAIFNASWQMTSNSSHLLTRGQYLNSFMLDFSYLVLLYRITELD